MSKLRHQPVNLLTVGELGGAELTLKPRALLRHQVHLGKVPRALQDEEDGQNG